MEYRFFIVDDDPSIGRILSKIILNNNLGDIVGISESGEDALQKIKECRPDIVLVDLLLPKLDGITLVQELKSLMPHVPFIMISEVYAKEMVSKAYSNGVEFYINKPINVIEVLGVLKRIDEKLKMQQVISSFQTAFASMNALQKEPDKGTPLRPGIYTELREIYSQLGILSEVGAKDLTTGIELLIAQQQNSRSKHLDFKLSEFYLLISAKYEREQGELVNEKTIEQRIRRAITIALTHLAELAIEDFDSLTLERYANLLFDLKEIRAEMRFVKGQSKEKGRINIKQFITGLVLEVQRGDY